MSDNVQKVWSPNRQCFFAVAGCVELISSLLEKIPGMLAKTKDRGWYSMIHSELPKIYIKLISDGNFKNEDQNAQIIYGSARKNRGSTIFNLAEFDFAFSQETARIGRNFKKNDFCAIGATKEIRKKLSDAAIENMNDLYHRTASISIMGEQDRNNLSKTLNLEKDDLVFTMHSGQGAGQPFLRKIRSFRSNELQQPEGALKLSGTLLLGAAAMKAIEEEMNEIRLKKFPYCESIGKTWHLSVLNAVDGFFTTNPSTQP
ncbi:MAG: hypothetical protein ACT6Q8_22695 [Niveispirillum sp.]|uniref:hypothetical protein n=1 Tax=Niveispirillum sp. TaxID=1917217 RepID=UPI004036D37D